MANSDTRHAPCEKPSSTMPERLMPAASTRSTSGAKHRDARRDAGSLVSVSAMKLCGYHVRSAAAGAR